MSELRHPQWSASFPDCVVELTPCRRTRLSLCAAGWLSLLFGTAFLVRLEVSISIKLLLLPVWWLQSGQSLSRFAAAQRDLTGLRVNASGACEVLGRGRKAQSAHLLAGSIVTPQWAWLRVADEAGRIYGELLLRGGVEATVWRRFQVMSQWGGIH
ncbi:MAG: hypothetical protein AAF417_14675 [Pseudomonadota bacterium]